MRFPLLALILTPAAIAASVAQAADPGEGKVSAASPTVAWKGQVINSGVTQTAWQSDPAAACEAPSCDTFTLEVADSGNLLLKLKGFAENRAGGDPTCSFRVIGPDGKPAYHEGPCGPKTELKYTIKNAAKGKYTIDVADSHVVSAPENYEASATLTGAAPPAGGPAPTPVATPAPTAAPPAPPASEPAPAGKLSAKVSKLSAKKLKKAKKFTVTLTSSTPLTAVNGILVNKKKQVGAGRVASLGSGGKLVVKLKKALKKGTYSLAVGGRDAQGRNVNTVVKVKIAR
jgi:hypothetical protein